MTDTKNELPEEYYICPLCGIAKAIPELVCSCQFNEVQAKMIAENEKK